MFTENVKAILRRTGAELTEELNKQLETLAKNPPPSASCYDKPQEREAELCRKLQEDSEVFNIIIQKIGNNIPTSKAPFIDSRKTLPNTAMDFIDAAVSIIRESSKDSQQLQIENLQLLLNATRIKLAEAKEDAVKAASANSELVRQKALALNALANVINEPGLKSIHDKIIAMPFEDMCREADLALHSLKEGKKAVEKSGEIHYRLLIDRIVRTQKVKQLIDAAFNQEKTGMSVMDIHRLLATPATNVEIDIVIESLGDDHITSVFPE